MTCIISDEYLQVSLRLSNAGRVAKPPALILFAGARPYRLPTLSDDVRRAGLGQWRWNVAYATSGQSKLVYQ